MRWSTVDWFNEQLTPYGKLANLRLGSLDLLQQSSGSNYLMRAHELTLIYTILSIDNSREEKNVKFEIEAEDALNSKWNCDAVNFLINCLLFVVCVLRIIN